MKREGAIFGLLCALTATGLAAEDPLAGMEHGQEGEARAPVLTEPGNDAFGTIQEVIRKLNARRDTDWSEVDLEALRQHLLDMRDMTVNVEVVSREAITNGLEVVIRPTTPRARRALERVLAAHPRQLRRETGWTMQVEEEGERSLLTVTSSDPADAEKIRGLGYIGLMAYGSHHQRHHWMIATGGDPHAHSR